jgi:uncharacterized cupredoxin-like copper-binding protein
VCPTCSTNSMDASANRPYLFRRFITSMKTFLSFSLAMIFSIAVALGQGGQKISVTMTEYHFDMPATAKAGPTTFVIKNTGRKEHAFEIKGEGIDQKLSPNPKSGQTGTLKVDLKPGTYTINCPLPFHTMRGMKTTLTVK